MGFYIPKYLEMHSETARLTIQLIRNYDRFKEKAEALLAKDMGIRTDGQKTTASVKADPTAATAESREKLLEEIRAIDEAINQIPEEYRKVVWAWVKEGRPLYTIDGSQYASERTWYEYKRRFVTAVARRKGWIE